MNEKAICPLLSTAAQETPCKQQDCAWYDGFQCAVLTVKNHLNDIVNNTSYIYIQDSTAQMDQIKNAVVEIKEALKK